MGVAGSGRCGVGVAGRGRLVNVAGSWRLESEVGVAGSGRLIAEVGVAGSGRGRPGQSPGSSHTGTSSSLSDSPGGGSTDGNSSGRGFQP